MDGTKGMVLVLAADTLMFGVYAVMTGELVVESIVIAAALGAALCELMRGQERHIGTDGRKDDGKAVRNR